MTLRVAARLDGIERTLIRQIADAAPADAINLGLGQPDLSAPPSVSLAALDGIACGRTFYGPTAGDPELRARIAGRYPGFADGAESVLVTVGSQEAMFASCLALVDPGEEVLYPDPGYPAYPVVARLAGARARAYPLRAGRAFRLDPDDVLEAIGPATRLVVLCSPGNPTGAVHGSAEIVHLVEELGRRGVAWLSDEVYAGFSYDGPPPSPWQTGRGGGVVISSLSKDLCMTGFRVGWVTGPREVIARIVAVHQYLVTCAPLVSQNAALAAFSPPGEADRTRILDLFRRRRAIMAEELARIPDLRVEMPDGAFYFFVDLSAHGGSLALCRRILERRRVVTIPGIAFGPRGEGFVRLSYAASEEAIVAGVRAIAAELAAG